MANHEPPHKRAKKESGISPLVKSNVLPRTKPDAYRIKFPSNCFAQTWNCGVLSNNADVLPSLTNSAKLVYQSKFGGASFWISHRDCFSHTFHTPLENIVKCIYRSFVAPDVANGGCEWWVQVRPDDDKATNQQDREAVRFHFDKDEEEFVSHNRSVLFILHISHS